MEHKLLVITAGTVAAGVGKEFIRQKRAHTKSEIKESVRYIDTADLQTRYSDLRDGEWLQVSIEPRFIDNIQRNERSYPYLKPLLFDNLMPQIQGSGGGSIRYNAAGAVAIQRDRLKDWIHNGITNLISSGDGRVNLSIALIVSAVGATGSGALERLVEIIVDAAQDAKIPSPIHCDVFILQPGPQDVTDLGLSNTLALYAEMAASRLERKQSNNKSYRGRTVLIDWGTKTNMSSIEQLKEAAATLVRLAHDPATDIAAEYQEREVDNHVLREQDTDSGLPSHLSTATVVTISLGDLQEKIIQRDAARLVDLLVFGKNVPSQTSSGEVIVTSSTNIEPTANVMLGVLNGLLNGQTAEERLSHLMLTLKNVLPLQTPFLNQGKLRDQPPRDQAGKLRGTWQYDKDTIARSGGRSISLRGAELAGDSIRAMEQTRKDRMGTGLSLQQLHNDFQDLHDKINEVIAKLQDMNPAGEDAISQQVGDDALVNNKLSALDRARRWNKDAAFSQAFSAVQNDIESRVRLETMKAAYEVLEILEQFSARSLRDLKAVLKKLTDQRKKNALWAAADQELRIDMHHPLHLAALPSHEEISQYIQQISIFTTEKKKQRTSLVARIMTGDNREEDQLADFRRWLDEDEEKIGKLFKGDIELFLSLAQQYTREQVDEEVKENNVLKVLIRAGDEVLRKRMVEAAEKAHTMVSFSREFAPHLREATHVSAFWETEEERGLLQKAISDAFGQRRCTLIKSKDPTEIAVFYYVDGLPMSAITDLTGRCLDAFMKRRRAWHILNKAMQNGHHGNGQTFERSWSNQRVGVPVYSGKDAQERVEETGIIGLLYRVRGQNVGAYTKEDVPELGLPFLMDALRQDEDKAIPATQPLRGKQSPGGSEGNGNSHDTGDSNGANGNE